MSGYSFGKLTESKALTRIVFLETVAGVPGSVASTLRQYDKSHIQQKRKRSRADAHATAIDTRAQLSFDSDAH